MTFFRRAARVATLLSISGVGCGSSSPSDNGAPDTSDASSVEGGAATDASADATGASDGTTNGATDGTTGDGGSTTSSILDVSSSGGHACAVSADGRLRCWGANNQGQLGDGTTTPHPTPIDVPGITGAIAVSAKANHTCAVVAGGAVKCWGDNYNGVLGAGGTNQALVPLDVPTVTGAKSVTTGSGHSCAILTNGSLRCWGSNYYGQLGPVPNPPNPSVLMLQAPAVQVGCGNGFTCAALTDGTAWCWGAGSEGELGDGKSAFSSGPVQVSGLTNVVGIASGQGQNCAVLADGTARCWGSNAGGALGDGKTEIQSATPVVVAGLSGAKQIDANEAVTMVLLADGSAAVWPQPQLATVPGLTGATKVSAGGCAIVGAGVSCWMTTATPTPVPGLP